MIMFSGHRPPKSGSYDGKDRLALAVKQAIHETLEQYRPQMVISGCALGVDQWGAQEAIQLNIPVIWAIPFKGFDSKWPQVSRDELRSLYRRSMSISGSSHHIVCEPGYHPSKLQKRNAWMCDQLVDKNDWLVAVHDGSEGGTKNCIQYYLRSGKTRLLNLWPRVQEILES